MCPRDGYGITNTWLMVVDLGVSGFGSWSSMVMVERKTIIILDNNLCCDVVVTSEVLRQRECFMGK
jgi:hypothetical protein